MRVKFCGQVVAAETFFCSAERHFPGSVFLLHTASYAFAEPICAAALLNGSTQPFSLFSDDQRQL